jgi:phosphonate transport system ATP-binding protein
MSAAGGMLRAGPEGQDGGPAGAPGQGIPTVALVGICKSYAAGVAALSDVSFTVARGEFVVILGRSGAGKSTLMRTINRLAVPTSGQVFLNGREITDGKGELRRARGQIGMVFQQFNLVKRLPVITNVLCGRLSHRSAWRSLLYSFTHEDRAIAIEALAQVDLDGKTFQRADTLSGGEQQRVAIARALAQKPKLILADEPVASLDPKNARQVLQCLKQVAAQLGISVICNLHQVDYAREYAERIVGLARGKIVFDGPVGELTEDVLHQIYGDPSESEHGEA